MLKKIFIRSKQLIAIFAQGSRGDSRDNGEEEEEEVREIMEQGTVKFRLFGISNQLLEGKLLYKLSTSLCYALVYTLI